MLVPADHRDRSADSLVRRASVGVLGTVGSMIAFNVCGSRWLTPVNGGARDGGDAKG